MQPHLQNQMIVEEMIGLQVLNNGCSAIYIILQQAYCTLLFWSTKHCKLMPLNRITLGQTQTDPIN
jgi:hypothetical protein